MKRFVLIGDRAFPVASVSTAMFPRSKAAPKDFAGVLKNARAWAEELRGFAKAPKWTEEKVEGMNAVIFRADWKKQNRFMQVAYRDLGDRVAISFASTRRLYVLPIGEEANQIQQRLVARYRAKTAATAGPIQRLLFPDAVAQASSFNLSPISLGLGGQTLTVSGLSGSFNANDLYAKLTQYTSTTVPNALNRVETDAANNANAFTSQQLGKANAFMDAQYGKIDSLAATNISRVSNLEQQTFRDLNKFTSNGNLARMAAVTTATAVLTSSAIGFAAQLAGEIGVAVASNLYHSIMGTLTNEQIAKMSDKAQRGIAQLNGAWQQLSATETALDTQIAALEAAAKFGDVERLAFATVSSLNYAQHDFDREMAKADGARQRSNPSEQQFCEARAYEAYKKVQELKGALAMFQSFQGALQGGKDAVCSRTLTMIRQWRSAEAAMQNARMLIVNNSSATLRGMMGEYVEAHTPVSSPRRMRNTCKDFVDQIESLQKDVRRNPADQTKLASLENARAAGRTCDQNERIQAMRDPAYENGVGVSLMRAALDDVNSSVRDIIAAGCEPGNSSELCRGQVGSFRLIHAKYENMIKRAKQFCPEYALEGPNDNPYGAPAAGAAPGAVPLDPGENRPSFVARAWNSVSNAASDVANFCFGWI